MGRLASEPEDHAATGQQRRPWCTNVLAAAAVIADVIGDCADTIHVALPASTSDKAHYVTLARRVFPGVRTLAYGQTATVRGEASEALCCLMYSVRCTRQDAPLPLSALDCLKQRTDALLLGW
jgi:Flp pilus assembly protein CpaB